MQGSGGRLFLKERAEILKDKLKQGKDPLVVFSAAKMSMGTFLSRILGFVRDVLLAQFFSRTITDSFVIAFRIPNFFRRIFGEGSLASGFIPIFLDHLKKDQNEKESKQKALNLAGGVWASLLLFTTFLTSVFIFWMDDILSWILSGSAFLNVPGKLSQTVFLARLAFTYFFFVTQFAFFMCMLNALGHFFLPALAPAVFNFIMILFILIPSDWLGTLPFSYLQIPGFSLGLGVFVGGFFQMALVFYALYKKSYLPRLKWRGWREMGVFKVIEKVIPSLIGLTLLQIISFVNIHFASFLEEGTHSSLYWGDRILELPQSLIAISLGTALLPKLSKLWSSKEKHKMTEVLIENINLLLFLVLPSCIGLYLLASPIIEVFFMRGEFQKEDLMRTVKVLHFYSFFLIASSLSKLLTSAFYACKKPWWPSLVSAFTLMLHVLVAFFSVKAYGLYGLIGATTLSGFFQFFCLFFIYSLKIDSNLKLTSLFRYIFKTMPSLFLMTLFLLFVSPFLFSVSYGGKGERFFSLFFMVFSSALLYFFMSFLLKIPQIQLLLKLFKTQKK